jgi:hypothetical protein
MVVAAVGIRAESMALALDRRIVTALGIIGGRTLGATETGILRLKEVSLGLVIIHAIAVRGKQLNTGLEACLPLHGSSLEIGEGLLHFFGLRIRVNELMIGASVIKHIRKIIRVLLVAPLFQKEDTTFGSVLQEIAGCIHRTQAAKDGHASGKIDLVLQPVHVLGTRQVLVTKFMGPSRPHL